jgi:helix-turn-helix, Psq domain.
MPAKRSEKAQKAVQQEGRILLAIKALQNGRFSSVAAAARSFDVPRTTLSARIKGRTN